MPVFPAELSGGLLPDIVFPPIPEVGVSFCHGPFLWMIRGTSPPVPYGESGTAILWASNDVLQWARLQRARPVVALGPFLEGKVTDLFFALLPRVDENVCHP